MAVTEVVLPRLHAAQWEIVSSPARFRVAACGRRFGKTLAAAGEAVRAAASGAIVWWVAPTFEVTRRGWDGVINIVAQIPGCEVRRGVREVLFPGGGVIAFKTADSNAGLLGAGLDLVVVDEAALVREEAWTRDLRPALSDREGRALFISTPRGHNWFWKLWQRGIGGDGDWKSWSYPTSANPYIKQSEIESARREMPERFFRQEYLAEFIEDAGAVFRRVMDAIVQDVESEPVPGHEYVFGVDWARDNDFTAIAVLNATTGRLVALERFNQIGWSLQRGRLKALADYWKPQVILAEENSIGSPNIEALQQDGLPVQPFQTTAHSKPQVIEALALAFERGEIGIVQDDVLISELQSYAMKRLPSGRFQYSAPSGMHDDTVIALALAWWAKASQTRLEFFWI